MRFLFLPYPFSTTVSVVILLEEPIRTIGFQLPQGVQLPEGVLCLSTVGYVPICGISSALVSLFSA